MGTDKLETGDVYEGAAGLLRDSPWLTHEMISPEKDTVVQIEAVIRRKQVKFPQSGDVKRDYGSIRFVGAQRELGLNSTHIHTLSALFGPMCKDWKGKYVALYVDPDVKAFGKIVSAVRIRPQKIKPPEAKAAAQNGGERPDIKYDPNS